MIDLILAMSSIEQALLFLVVILYLYQLVLLLRLLIQNLTASLVPGYLATGLSLVLILT